jgi:hypothetical protein
MGEIGACLFSWAKAAERAIKGAEKWSANYGCIFLATPVLSRSSNERKVV